MTAKQQEKCLQRRRQNLEKAVDKGLIVEYNVKQNNPYSKNCGGGWLQITSFNKTLIEALYRAPQFVFRIKYRLMR